jgi:ubiquinone/menaquinone biosynthesis C-methylase UbiE
VLDAACGVGYGAAMMAEEGKATRVVGLDLSSEAIDQARKRYGQIQNVEFLLGSVEELPFDDSTFDVYTSFETIEHVPHPDRLLCEAVRVLKPDGALLISTPNRTLTNPGTTLEGKPFNRFHLREWSLSEFDKLLREFFPSVELLTQAPFSHKYIRRLTRIGKRSRWLGFRMHQLCKLLLEIAGRFPDCAVRTLKDGYEGEVCVAVCRKSRR